MRDTRGSRIRGCTVLLVLVVSAIVSAQAQGSLSIPTSSLPAATAGANFRSRIAVTGGSQPYTWQVVDGKLPSGLRLNPATGVISGTPTATGSYRFAIVATDSNIPANRAQRTYTINVTAALTVEWKSPPAVHGQMLEGSVVVSNLTVQDVTLTVIVMGVNEIGRATALGYQEFTLRSGAQQAIPFGSSPGSGTYVVHADAVAEVARTNTIYRARKQTTEPLVIQPQD
jgi:Putative Ig domain